MSQQKKQSELNALHRKGSSFREFVQRQVDEARISFVDTNFGSIQRNSSFAHPRTSSEKGNSLLVTPSGDIIQQAKERRSNSLYDKENVYEDERSEDGNEGEGDIEGRVIEESETLSVDEEENTVIEEKREVTGTKEEDDREEERVGDGEEKPENKEEEVEGEEERTGNIEEKIGNEGETPGDDKENIEEGEKSGDGQEIVGDGEEKVGETEGKVIFEEEKSGEEEKEAGEEEEKEGVNEVNQEEGSGKTHSEDDTQEKEQNDDEQQTDKEDKGEDTLENREHRKTETGGEDVKKEEEEEESKNEEEEESQMEEHEQEIITKAIHSSSIRADDVVSLGLGSEIGIKGESVSSSIEHEKLTERLKQINFELSYVNRKNRFLTKAVVDIRGKKVDTDTGESKLTEGYLKKLVNFEKIKFSIQNEMKRINDQVDVLRERSRSSVAIYEAAQDELLQKVSDAYKKLDSNFGSLASEKTIVQPTHRIQTALANVSKMRLKMLKLQNHLAEKEAQLKSLDDRGGGLHLIDYEKLKMHNQHLIETIAERDLELLRLRKKIETDTQKLAHVRERAKIIGEENRDYHATLEELDAEIKLAREDVNNKKQKRQRITVETQKMRQDAGLLTKPKLVTSFRQTELDLESAKNQFNEIMQVYHQQKKKIVDLKERLHSSTELANIIKN